MLQAVQAVRNLGKGLAISCRGVLVRTFLKQREQCLQLVWRGVVVWWCPVVEETWLWMSVITSIFFGLGQLQQQLC